METKMADYFNPKLTDEVLYSLQKKFTEKRYLFIDSVLDPTYLSEMEKFVVKDTPDDWWLTASKYAYPGENDPTYLFCYEENRSRIIEEWEKAHEAFKRGYFSYQFDRIDTEHVEGCVCFQCGLSKGFLSIHGPLQGFLEKVTGLKFTKVGEWFFSRFKANQFLAQHHDKDKGKLGMTLNLTREWHPSWGACLSLYDPEKKEVFEVFPPILNRMILFHLPEGKGIEHWVNHVSPKIEKTRYSLTCFFE